MAESRTLRFHNPSTLPRATGYSQIVEVHGGRTIYIAGQVALDTAGQLVGPGDPAAQAEQVFANLHAALVAAGATFRDVVKLTYFVTDIGSLPAIRTVRNRYVDVAHPPASSAVEVRRLFRDDVLIEIEAIAVAAEQNNVPPDSTSPEGTNGPNEYIPRTARGH
jgi:reactive intermediate/imine deaminase